ncbi:hypothetical protein NC652_019656 [Populus alba x Populus x berolinensis]|nr:hypothetical protein NC652_019656 [Populus alba x Populus x berolinensis]
MLGRELKLTTIWVPWKICSVHFV